MRFYAEAPGLRWRQVARDAAVVGWVWLWVRLGQVLHDVVGLLAVPGRAVARAGEELAAAAGAGGARVADVPLVGGLLERPFGAIGDGGRSLVSAGGAQEEAVLRLALWLAVLLAAPPILAVLGAYVPLRLRWAREAGAAAALRQAGAGAELFALRALARRPLRDLRRVADDPWAAYAAGDVQDLAALELRRLGLRGVSDGPDGRAASSQPPQGGSGG